MPTPAAGRNGRLYMDSGAAGTGSASLVQMGVKWNIDRSTDEFDGTYFGAGSKIKIVGLPGADISFEAFFDPTSPGIVGVFGDGIQGRKFYLYTTNSAASYFYGTGAISGSIDVDVNGLEKITGKISNDTSVYFQA